MPLIDVQVLEGVFSTDEKQALIKELAMAFGKVAGKTMQDNTSVRIHAVKSGHWGGAESVWTTEKARELKREPG
jgi:4-oxalocrotonate tautomerase